MSYAFAVTNNGPSMATNVTVTDTVAARHGVRERVGGVRRRAGTVTCTVGTLTPGAAPRSASSSDAAVQPGHTNNVTVSAAETDPIPATTPSPRTHSRRSGRRANRQDRPGRGDCRRPVVYTLVVQQRPVDRRVRDRHRPTPAGLTFVPTAAPARRRSRARSGRSRRHVGDHHVHLQVPSGRTAPNPITTSPTVCTSTFGDVVTTTSTVTTPLSFSTDIAVAKTASTMLPGVGTSFDYVITATNLGPSNVTGVVITESRRRRHQLSVARAIAGHLLAGQRRGLSRRCPPAGSATLTVTVRGRGRRAAAQHRGAHRLRPARPNPANDIATSLRSR